MPQPVAYCLNHEHSNWQGSKVLLKLEVSVHRQEDVKPGRSECKQLPVLDARPSAELYRGNLVANK